MSSWSLCAEFCDATSGTFWIRMPVLQFVNVVYVRFRESSLHFHSLFSRRIEMLFRLSFQGTTNCSLFRSIAMWHWQLSSVSNSHNSIWSLVLLCCHRHTLCVGPGVASIALKRAATALFLAFDTVVLQYGATTAAPRSCHQIWNTLFIKFITTIRLVRQQNYMMKSPWSCKRCQKNRRHFAGSCRAYYPYSVNQSRIC